MDASVAAKNQERFMASRFCSLCRPLLLLACAYLTMANPQAQTTNRSSLSIIVAAGQQGLRISWPSNASDYVLEEAAVITSNWQSSALAPALNGDQFIVSFQPAHQTRFFRIRSASNLSAFRILSHTPTANAAEVGVTYRPQIFFSRKARPGTLTTNSVYATVGGEVVPANVVPASDGSFVWLFFKKPLPGATRVRVTVDGTTIASEGALTLLDGDGEGRPGGALNFEFTTVSLAELLSLIHI